MNVLQVSYLDLPGRRFNGYDLLDALEPFGIRGKQAVLEKWSHDSRVTELLRGEGDLEFQESLVRMEKQHSLNNVLYPWGRRLASTRAFQDADVVHYHIIHQRMISLLDLPMLFSAKPSVWTFHDPWPLTGHCVHPEKCEGWLTGCDPCPYLDVLFPLREDKAGAMWQLKQDVYGRVDPDIVVASGFMLDMLERSPLARGFDRVHLVPFGVDTDLFSPEIDRADARRRLGIPEQDFVVFCRASEWPLKGLEVVKEALSLHAPLRPTTVLTVDRTGLVDDLKDSYRIVEAGHIADTAMCRLYAAADVFLMPSTAESFGMVALEAMACGTPVVASQVGGLAYLVQDGVTGFTVPVDDPQALTDRLMSLLSDAELRSKMGEQAVRYAQGYAWENIARRLVAVYRELCSEKAVKEIRQSPDNLKG